MKWVYNSKLGCFEREDKLGKKLWITMTEAQRIITLRDLGNSIGEIQAKMNFVSNKASSYSVKTVLERYDNGDIVIDMNVPVSEVEWEDLSNDSKINDLEMRISNLENIISEYDENSFMDKVKSWLKY